jgi:uncharacterized integral membrane protein
MPMVGSAGGGPEGERPAAKRPRASRREQARTVVAVALAAVITLFAVLNFDEVEVNWLLGTWSTPLIIVIAISFLLGAVSGFLLARRRRGPAPR